jgi:hypothetical protein
MKYVFKKIWFHQGFIGYTNSKEGVPPKKKPKLTKRQGTKFMMTKKEPEHFYQHVEYIIIAICQ